MNGKHEITKMRKEPVRRKLRVAETMYVTPRMLRVVLRSGELAGFESASPDDHVKVFFPGTEGREEAKRDFTPRAWDLAAGTFTLEFALHEHGPAAAWARSARVGDELIIGGPRGSLVVPDDFDWYWLIGDACALPSFARRLENLRAGVPVEVFAQVEDDRERQDFRTAAQCRTHWLTGADGAADAMLTELSGCALPPGDGFIWIAAEAEVAREVHAYLTQERGHPAEWVKAAAYWSRRGES